MMLNDEKFMAQAVKLAKLAQKNGDVPVGAIIVRNGEILSRAYNKKNAKNNCLCHAEMLAINKACKKLNNFRIDNSVIYVTKEPCLMCMGAILSARINKIVYGCSDKRFGAMYLAKDNNFNHKCEVVSSVLEKQCAELLTSFFSDIRKNKKTKTN